MKNILYLILLIVIGFSIDLFPNLFPKNGPYTEDHMNGKEVGTYENGKKNGSFIIYYNNDWVEEGEYIDGMKEGDFLMYKYTPGGKSTITGKYKNDLRNGPFEEKWSNGQVEIGNYLNGVKNGEYIHYSSRTDSEGNKLIISKGKYYSGRRTHLESDIEPQYMDYGQ